MRKPKASPAAQPEQPKTATDRSLGMKVMARKAKEQGGEKVGAYDYPVRAPDIIPNVVPKGKRAPVLATDNIAYNYTNFFQNTIAIGGFPGFAYLSQLATRPEYRAFASTISTELTRKWGKFVSKSANDAQGEKIKAIEAEFQRLGIRNVFQMAAAHDCLFGRAQIYIGIRGQDKTKPLILSPKTIPKGSLERVCTVEALWTTPATFNANDPTAPDFYKPPMWFMLGEQVHASRLMTIITRPLPDMLKAAFNFAGISLSQLAEPYVDNWLRTRQSVSDLINNFSITVLQTAMDQVLQGDDLGDSVIARANLFTATRSNLGVMLLDKDREDLLQVNTPLSGLHELQAQALEFLCVVSRIPSVILTGVNPSGFNASSEGEIQVFYDWISAQQESFWREPIETILKVVQLSLFGEIDHDISFVFEPLYQMTDKEKAEIEEINSRTATGYLNAGVVDAEECRQMLADDPDSIFQGLDMSKIMEPVDGDGGVDMTGIIPDAATDKSVSEKQHKAMEAAAHGKSTLGIPEKVGKEFVSKGVFAATDNYSFLSFDEDISDFEYGWDDPDNYEIATDGWKTVHPNGKESKGQHVEIGEGGEIKAGMGGKFNGQNIKDLKGSGNKTESKKESTLSDEQRNAIAKSPQLYDSHGAGKMSRGEFKEKARSGEFDHLQDELDQIKKDQESAVKSEKERKNKEWRDKHLPKLFAAKKEREEKARAEKKEKINRAISHYEAVNSKNKTYLNVPFSEKDIAKAAGAFWDADKKKWFVGGDVPESLQKYASQKQPEKVSQQSTMQPGKTKLPRYGNVSPDDPSIHGSWLLGHEGEPWSRVRMYAPEHLRD